MAVKSNHECTAPDWNAFLRNFWFSSRWRGSLLLPHSFRPISQSQIRINRKVMKTAEKKKERRALIIWLTKSAWWLQLAKRIPWFFSKMIESASISNIPAIQMYYHFLSSKYRTFINLLKWLFDGRWRFKCQVLHFQQLFNALSNSSVSFLSKKGRFLLNRIPKEGRFTHARKHIL